MAEEARTDQEEGSNAGSYELRKYGEAAQARDRDQLARLGKRSVLKRNFGFVTILSFSCTVLVTWEGVLILFATGFRNGGPAGLIYQFILVWLGTLSTFITIAELVSMAPTAGGQYHWVYMLSPRSMRTFLSYLTGWMTVLAWQALIASGGFLSAGTIQGLVILVYPTYVPQPWHLTLMVWAVIALVVFFNTVVGRYLPKIEGVFMIVHILGFFAVLIPMVYMGPQIPASEAFTLFVNGGNWPTQGLSFMVGLLGYALAFAGGDAAVHMSEEIENPAINGPRSIVGTIILNGAMGFGTLIAMLVSISDVDRALDSPTDFPFIEVLRQATESIDATIAMTTILASLSIAGTTGFAATSSRMMWSFARDNGLPFSKLLKKVGKNTTLPIPAIIVTTIIACLLALIVLGSIVAFNALTSLSLAAFYSSYFACCTILLWRRCTNGIQERGLDQQKSAQWNDNIKDFELIWGPWRIPGILGIANNLIACCYLLVVFFFSFWPPAIPVDASTMNFSVLVWGTVFLFSIAFYFGGARKTFSGPVIEVALSK